MNPIYIIVEGESDRKLLAKMLPEQWQSPKKVKFIVANGRSAAISDARTFLVTKQRPVAVVVDADTNDPQQALQDREQMRQLLKNAALGISCEAFVALPNLNAVHSVRSTETKLVKEIVAFLTSVSPS